MKKMDYLSELKINSWSDEKIQAFQVDVLSWYDRHKRNLPWRQTKDPYKIWVSEIMLQQTQVATVIPYYQRFIEKLPDLESLAQTPEDQLLKLWEGLGYYSRAKNMQAAAKQIMEDFAGVFPACREDIEKLKGIGPYTSGAIASIAFGERTPAVDGNVMRVFSRLFEIEADISKARTKKLFEALIIDILPEDRPGDFNQAIMDLGARKSMPKNYETEDNPLLPYDLSYQKGTWENFPIKNSKTQQTLEPYYAVLIKNKAGQVFLEKRPSTGLLANFWTFPFIKQEDILNDQEQTLLAGSKKSSAPVLTRRDQNRLEEILDIRYDQTCDLLNEAVGIVDHVFSHRKWVIYALVAQSIDQDFSTDQTAWVDSSDFSDYAFPVPQQKLLDLYGKHELL